MVGKPADDVYGLKSAIGFCADGLKAHAKEKPVENGLLENKETEAFVACVTSRKTAGLKPFGEGR